MRLRSNIVVFPTYRFFAFNNLESDKWHQGCLPFTTNSRKFRFGIFVRKERYVSFTICPQISGLSRRARLDSYLLLLLKRLRSERPETSTKLEELVNGKRISIRNSSGVPTGKTGLPFQNFRLSREFSSGTNRKNVYHLDPTRNFREFVVNGKQPKFHNCFLPWEPRKLIGQP